MTIKEFMGLPSPPSVEEIKNNPKAVEEFLNDMVNSLSDYLKDIVNHINNEVLFVKERLGVGTDEPAYEADVVGTGNFTEAIAIPANKKMMLEGPTGDTYIIYNTTTGFIEFFINGVREGHLDPTLGWVIN